MNIKISIYDFFSYTIPGSLFLFSVAYALIIFGVIPAKVLLLSPSFLQIIFIIGLAYLLGLLIEPIGKFWYRLFRPKNHSEVALNEYRRLHPMLNIHFRAKDWPVLLAYIQTKNPDVASEIERVNATNIMLRNVSFLLISLALIEVVRFAFGFDILHLSVSILLIVFSIIAGKEAVKFAQWFYFGIFENISSNAIKVSDLVTVKQEKAKNSNEENAK